MLRWLTLGGTLRPRPNENSMQFPQPRILPKIGAPRRVALSAASRRSEDPPSPGINPSLSRSRGLKDRAPNLHLDITSIVDYWRHVAHDLGPARVFFATGMPFYDPAIFVSSVQYASDLDDADKQAVCGGNMRRLLRAVQ